MKQSKVADPSTTFTTVSPDMCGALVELLSAGKDYVIVLDESLALLDHNEAFLRELASLEPRVGAAFESLLKHSSCLYFRQLAASGALDGVLAELHHDLPSGTRTVQYRFRRVEDGWLALGRDQSVQMELVSQMSSLVEELATRVTRERALTDKMRALAERDHLTGLANRRYFETELRSACEKFSEEDALFTVAVLDLDHFKSINDDYGHVMGDEVLRRVAKAVLSCTRDRDVVARYGGEEFVVLISGVDLAKGGDVAERIRRVVEAELMPESVRSVTVSIGVATVGPGDETDPGGLVKRADTALYEAKRDGRNCVRLGGVRGEGAIGR